VTAAFLLFLLAIPIFAKGTPLGNAIHRWSVEVPAAALNRASAGHVLVALVLIVLTGAAIRYGITDWLRVTAMGLPDFTLWAMSFEVGVYLDAVAILAAISVVARVRLVRTVAVAYAASFSPRRWTARLRERRRRRGTRPIPAESGEDGIAFAFAA
jgi:hypothetical protein